MPAPTSTLSLVAAKLARMVALSATFQSETGGSAANAAGRVFRRNVPDPQRRPFACVSHGDAHRGRLVAGGAQNYLRQAGDLFLYLARDVPAGYRDDLLAAEDDAANWFGAVIEQVSDIAAADDADSVDGTSHLPLVSFERVAFGEADEQDWQSLGRFYHAVYQFSWGDGDQ